MAAPPSPLNVSRETLDRLRAFEQILLTWALKVNLVSRETLGDVWGRHIWDSYQVALYIKDKKASILDIGSGAGFPGLVLAVAGYCQVTLVEKDQKKCSFLKYVAATLGINVVIISDRIETLPPKKYDFITSRACTSLKSLLNFSLNFTDDSSRCIFLKGENWELEYQEALTAYSFKVEAFESLTHPLSKVLMIKEVKKRP